MKTLSIGRNEFHFEVTPKLKKLVKVAHVKLEQVGKAKKETRRFAFLAVRAATETRGENFSYKFEDFLQLVEPAVMEKAKALAAELLGTPKAKKKKNNPQKAAKKADNPADGAAAKAKETE